MCLDLAMLSLRGNDCLGSLFQTAVAYPGESNLWIARVWLRRKTLSCGSLAMNTYKRNRFKPDIISYAACLYYHFNLSLQRSMNDTWMDR